MNVTDKKLGGWSLVAGTLAIAVAYVLSPGRGAIDTVPSTSLTDLTLAMARNEALAYTMPIIIVFGALLMLNGLLVLRRYAGPIPRLGLTAMSIALIIQMVMRGFDYMIVGYGVASLENEGAEAERLLNSAVALQRVVWGMHFSSSVAGFAGTAVMALGLAFHPEPVRLPPLLNGIVAALAVASAVVFVAAWHSNELELALQPVFAAMSVSGLIYMGLLARGLIKSEDSQPS